MFSSISGFFGGSSSSSSAEKVEVEQGPSSVEEMDQGPSISKKSIKKKSTKASKRGRPAQKHFQSLEVHPIEQNKEQQEGEEEDELVAFVLTIHTGSSYDALFREVAQEVEDGERVAVYGMELESVPLLLSRLQKQGGGNQEAAAAADSANVSSMLKDLADLEDPSSAVFNFECCSACQEDTGFCSGGVHNQLTLEFMQLCLQRGYMVMCSDFSLKALIKAWDTVQGADELLGPNPFVDIGTLSSNMQLRFDPKKLLDCDSEQLKTVGELCAEGVADVGAMSGTILYTVDPAKADTGRYALEVLTVLTLADGEAPKVPRNRACGVRNSKSKVDYTGAAGHVALTYPSGGVLLTSCGHWLELSHLGGVSEEALVEVARKGKGGGYVRRMQADLQSARATPALFKRKVQQYSAQVVRSSAPAKKGVSRSKKGGRGW